VQRAIEKTLQRNETAYSYYKYIRRQIIHNNDNRHPEYLQRLRHFQYVHCSPQDYDEWALLEDLYHSPLCEQYRVETSHKPYLATAPELDKALKQIRSVIDPFYEYTIPPHIAEAAIEKEREAREAKHAKAVNIRDLQTIISKARAWRECKENPWQLVACALILSGRRVIEIVETLEWEKAGDYLASVTGIAKQDNGDEPAIIPLLCPYEEFDELMQMIRAIQPPSTNHTYQLRMAFDLYFGQWYNHSERRNIYGEAGFRDRQYNQFYPEMSRVMWIDKALAHSGNVVMQAGNLTYQSLVFQDDR
jgi:hypothetical protein